VEKRRQPRYWQLIEASELGAMAVDLVGLMRGSKIED
jgi:hypothetical protein